ncbi:hypothetical protein [Sphingobacterium humi]|uniref:Uncharacterized protein n=1 Tax=Sphingobacterium humi TaxID=1796905 RepID=A0A6N8L454_9SPHI|nr:hypothetical protein [Sphingobacterium humi]MVZ62958.1 hypothetical protein [Sphingobacterium humi]
MKFTILSLFFLVFCLLTGCKKEKITLYNILNSPNLTNPIIQKISNQVWYKDNEGFSETWSTQNNIFKPSDYVSSMLYQAAWTSLTLYRDGTSNMLFMPPYQQGAAIHCKGNWSVATDEENTLILSTKTPVSSVTGKIKILNMENKGNVNTLKLAIDFGDRVLETQFSNRNPNTYSMESAAYVAAIDNNWFASQPIQTSALKAEEFIGAWVSPHSFSNNGQSISSPDFPLEGVMRITYIEDLLMNTPAFFNGVLFNLQDGGKAQIAYPFLFSSFYKSFLNNSKDIVSNARWTTKGNKLLIETDEDLFLSLGEGLFGLKPHAGEQIYIGERADSQLYTNAQAIRILPKQIYIIELIRKTDKGFWARISTKNAIFYAFLSKTTFDSSNTINIRESHR